jgi:hypothetical protein
MPFVRDDVTLHDLATGTPHNIHKNQSAALTATVQSQQFRQTEMSSLSGGPAPTVEADAGKAEPAWEPLVRIDLE